MQDITVAAITMNSLLGQTDHNLEQVERIARSAAAAGAELLCFPELVISGHWCAGGIWDVAEPVPEGPSVRHLCALAAELGVFMSVGLAEREAGIAYNTQVMVGPDGYLGRQRKLHMSADEYFHFRTGSAIPVFDIGKARVAIGICYDNNLPEVARIAAVHGAELYLMPHAARIGPWPEDAQAQARAVAGNKAHWRKVYAARAFENGMYVVVCDQGGHAGDEPDTNHAGGAMVFDPAGEIIAQSASETIAEEIVLCRLEAERVSARRRGRCFYLQTRRPEIYGALCRGTD